VPEFVLLGGLVPDLLCTATSHSHVGTTDVDVQVDLEIQSGSVNASRLEQALRVSGFRPDTQRPWRWRDESTPAKAVKVDFLADLDDVANHQPMVFDGCQSLGAQNLRGTGFASRDWVLRTITAELEETVVELRVATLPAYLLAKTHAAYGRSLPKDWYDIAYVLLHNDEGGPLVAARRVQERFGDAISGSTETALGELGANFADPTAQGTMAYALTMAALHPELDEAVLANDAIAAVDGFVNGLLAPQER
jgi:hypothetical protein